MKKERKYRICSNCVMDTTDSQITFDERGVCDHCNTFYKEILPNWYPNEKGLKILEEVSSKIKKSARGKDFDCIIGISGGIDSSFALYVAKEVMGLKPLVLHVDTGWNTELAVHNIENLINKMNLDLYTEVIDWQEMRELQLAFIKSGVPHIDTPQDHAIFASLYKFASKHKVKYILTGANFSTECVRNPVEWMYYQSDSVQVKDIFKKHGRGKLKNFPLTNALWHRFYLPFIKGIRVFKPLNFYPYQKEEALKLLEEKYNYKRYPQKHFESRFTRFYESYWLYERFGYDVRKVQFSSLILTGQMTREEALKKLQELPYDPVEIKKDIEYVADKLEISVDELMKYFYGPKRSFRDYKNMYFVYKLGAKISRLLGIERGGKR